MILRQRGLISRNCMEKLKIIAYFLIVLCVSAFFHLNTFAAKLTHENAKEGNKSSDVENSFNYYEKAADSGDANAQYYVGVCYAGGVGVEKDLNKAIEYLKKAADQGSDAAKETLKKLGN